MNDTTYVLIYQSTFSLYNHRGVERCVQSKNYFRLY